MGLQQRMMNMMMGRKSPEGMAKMMPQMMGKMGHHPSRHIFGSYVTGTACWGKPLGGCRG